MMRTPIAVNESKVHGLGIFTTRPIPAGAVLWEYCPPDDHRMDVYTASAEQLHYGYVNPRRPHDLVVVAGKARFWNFAPPGVLPNAIEAHIDRHGEAVIVAARNIDAGEELLIDCGSDADAARKLNLANSN